MKPTTRVHQQRPVAPRDAVAARLERHLVERRRAPSLESSEPWPVSKYQRAGPSSRPRSRIGGVGLVEQREVDAEGAVRGRRAADRLEEQVERRAAPRARASAW